MEIIYTNDKPRFNDTSIFLAGPSPRLATQTSWRIEALNILKDIKVNFPGVMTMNGWDGIVFVPEHNPNIKTTNFNYENQVEWEHECLTNCSIIVFWVPRDIKNDWLGLTTNVEFGRFAHQDNVFYGRPDNAHSCSYLDWYYKKCHKNDWPRKIIRNNIRNNLNDLLFDAVTSLA